MNRIKCRDCGFINFSGVQRCTKCNSDVVLLGNSREDFVDSQKSSSSDGGSSSGIKYVAIVVILCGGIFAIMAILNRGTNAPAAPTEKPDLLASAIDSQPTTVAGPPAGMNVAAPDIMQFEGLMRQELTANNGAEIANSSVSAPSSSDRAARESQISKLCGSGVPNCEQMHKEEGQRRQMEDLAHQANSKKQCPPKIDGNFRVMEAGNYLKLKDSIYYNVKVAADGEFGKADGSGGCTTKKDMIPLTARVHLKWSGSQWQPATQSEVNAASKADSDATKVATAERVERERRQRQ